MKSSAELENFHGDFIAKMLLRQFLTSKTVDRGTTKEIGALLFVSLSIDPRGNCTNHLVHVLGRIYPWCSWSGNSSYAEGQDRNGDRKERALPEGKHTLENPKERSGRESTYLICRCSRIFRDHQRMIQLKEKTGESGHVVGLVVTYGSCIWIVFVGFAETLKFASEPFSFAAHVRRQAGTLSADRIERWAFVLDDVYGKQRNSFRHGSKTKKLHLRQISSRMSSDLILSWKVCARRSLSWATRVAKDSFVAMALRSTKRMKRRNRDKQIELRRRRRFSLEETKKICSIASICHREWPVAIHVQTSSMVSVGPSSVSELSCWDISDYISFVGNLRLLCNFITTDSGALCHRATPSQIHTSTVVHFLACVVNCQNFFRMRSEVKQSHHVFKKREVERERIGVYLSI